MKNLVLSTMHIDDLISEIANEVVRKLILFGNDPTKLTDDPDDKILTRDQVCELLNISKATLWSYTKKGKLQRYGIGNRVYYKKDEVLNAVKPLKE